MSEGDWEQYEEAIVDLRLGDGSTLRIRPAPPGTVGPWPVELVAPVLFVTAWNPGRERPGTEVNSARQRELEAELSARGARLWPSVGWDADSPYREEGVAVTGLREEEVLALGSRYRQDAIYVLTSDAWSVVSCRDETRSVAGFTLERLAPPVAEGAGEHSRRNL